VSNHILSYHELMIDLSIVDLELAPDEIWQNSRSAGLGLDRDNALTRLEDRERETICRRFIDLVSRAGMVFAGVCSAAWLVMKRATDLYFSNVRDNIGS